jgi:hypothetical protein
MPRPPTRAAVRLRLRRWFRTLDATRGDERACGAAPLALVQWFDTRISPAEPARPGRQALTRSVAAAGRVLPGGGVRP